jgi:hypothetical protein
MSHRLVDRLAEVDACDLRAERRMERGDLDC